MCVYNVSLVLRSIKTFKKKKIFFFRKSKKQQRNVLKINKINQRNRIKINTYRKLLYYTAHKYLFRYFNLNHKTDKYSYVLPRKLVIVSINNLRERVHNT